jgi:hypothetical protein
LPRMDGAGLTPEACSLDDMVAVLLSLGVPLSVARDAAARYPNNIDAALDWACRSDRRHNRACSSSPMTIDLYGGRLLPAHARMRPSTACQTVARHQKDCLRKMLICCTMISIGLVLGTATESKKGCGLWTARCCFVGQKPNLS